MGKLSQCLSSLVPRLTHLPCGVPLLDPQKKFPSICPTHGTRRCQPPPAPAKECADPPHGSSGPAGLGRGEAAESTTGWQGLKRRPRPTGQAHRGGVRPRGGCPLPALTHHETLPPACLGTRQPVHPCRPDRQPGGVAGQSPCGKMRNGSPRPSAAFLACEVYLSTEGGRSQVPTHEMAQAIVSPSASGGPGS